LIRATRTSQCRILSVFTVCGLIFFFPSAEQLWAKSGKTMVALSAEGHSNFWLKRRPERAKLGRKIAAQVLTDLQGKGHVRQRSISDDRRFWLLLARQK